MSRPLLPHANRHSLHRGMYCRVPAVRFLISLSVAPIGHCIDNSSSFWPGSPSVVSWILQIFRLGWLRLLLANLLLRLYAVFNKDKRVLAFLFCVAVVVLCVDGVSPSFSKTSRALRANSVMAIYQWSYSFIGRGTNVSLVGGCHGVLNRSVWVTMLCFWGFDLTDKWTQGYS